MMGEARPWRDIGCHFASKIELPIRCFCEQRDHQILQCDHAPTRHWSTQGPGIGLRRRLSPLAGGRVPRHPRCPTSKAPIGAVVKGLSYGRSTGPANWRIRRRRAVTILRHRAAWLRRFECPLPQQGQSSFTYVLDGKAIFTHHDVAGTRRAEAVYAQHVTAIAGVAMPALRCTRLDGKSRVDRRQ